MVHWSPLGAQPLQQKCWTVDFIGSSFLVYRTTFDLKSIRTGYLKSTLSSFLFFKMLTQGLPTNIEANHS